jgi:hypothetical protein
MTLNIQLQLPPEYIDALRQRASEHGENLDVYISQIVAEEVQAELGATRRNENKANHFGEWLKSWAERHPQLNHVVDDSRESIYAGCGE